jgi:general L-amino acid transport system permease protein
MNWVRANLFSSWPNAIATLVIVWLAWKLAVPFLDWAFAQAIWTAPDSQVCRYAKGVSACWALIHEKHRFILFGTYPFEQHCRPALVVLILLALYIVSALRACWRPWLAAAWIVGVVAIGVVGQVPSAFRR